MTGAFRETHLAHVEPAHNMRRFYRLRVLPDLFAPASLQIAWGRMDQPERLRIAASGETEEMHRLANAIAHRKRAKGYVEQKLSSI